MIEPELRESIQRSTTGAPCTASASPSRYAMAASPPQADKLAAQTSGDHAIRVGQVYLDAQRQLLHCLNAAAHQLLSEGVPFTGSALAEHPLQTLEGKPVTRE